MSKCYINSKFCNRVSDHHCISASPKHTVSNGSVILAILGMAAVCSIAMLTTMLTIKSLYRTAALETQQINAKQALYEKHNLTVSHYQHSPITNDVITSTLINHNGIDYTQHLYPIVVRSINSPPLGYSLNSNYSTQHVQIRSQATSENVQTPAVVTGLSCLQTKSDELTSSAQNHYLLDDYFISAGDYHFNSDTGMIWKKTSTGLSLFMDMEFTATDEFGRADFAMVSTDNRTRLLMVFAVTQSQINKTDATNNLYIVFDDISPDETALTQIFNQDLTALTINHVATGREKGYRLPLTSGQLHVSAITTIAHTIIFITQLLSTDQHTGKPVYQNLLYQINLSAMQGPLLTIKDLPDTPHILNATTQQTNLTTLSLQSQTGLELLSFELPCHHSYQHEH